MKIGFAREKITPSIPYRMAGFDRRLSKAEGVRDDLYASCAALISDAGERAAFLVLDVLGTDLAMSSRISEAVDADGVWVSATHTHSAPSAIFTEGIYSDPEYQAFVTEQCRLAAEKAFAAARDAKASRALTGVCGIASVRNVLRGASSFEMPLLVLRFDTDAEPVLLVRFQCHPTVLNEANSLYSSDFPGGARKLLPEDTLLMNGACGDLSTRYTRQASTGEECDRLGAILAEAILGAETRTDETFGKRISIKKRRLPISRESSPTGEKLERLKRYFTEKSATCPDENEKREYDSILCVLNRAPKPAETREIVLTVADFGSVVLAGLPFEVRHDDALNIERELGKASGRPVYVAGYTGGYESYLTSGEPLSENSTYEDFAARYLPETRGLILNTLKEMMEASDNE